jgi:hypothetical protein
MLERSERLCSAHRAPRDGASSLALVPLASGNNPRPLRQPFATRSESRRSSIRGKTSLESHSCAIVQSNPFTMITFAKITSAPSAFGRSLPTNSFRIWTFGEYRRRKSAYFKPFRMIFLYKRENKCPGITSLQKKVGGGVWGRTFRAKPGESAAKRAGHGD